MIGYRPVTDPRLTNYDEGVTKPIAVLPAHNLDDSDITSRQRVTTRLLADYSNITQVLASTLAHVTLSAFHSHTFLLSEWRCI